MTLLEQASLVLIPSGYKEDTVYSVIPSNGSGDMSFTRASDGTRINSVGLVEVTPWNLYTYSEQLNDASWTKLNATITANATTAPNGTLTADLLVCVGGAAGTNYVRQAKTITDNTHTLSFYAKENASAIVKIAEAAITGQQLDYNLSTNTISGSGSQISGTITNDVNGWKKITFTYIYTTGQTNCIFNINSLSCFIWGVQLNTGSTAKPYFPTTDRLNVPRLTYQNGGGGCPSLLLEPQRTNICLYSEQLDNAAWTTLGTVTITANNTTSPDGTLNADKITATVNSFISQIINGVITTVYTWSCYIKNVDSVISTIRTRNTLTVQDANINWSGATISSITNITGVLNYVDVGNGWYRIFTTYTSLEAPQRTRIYTDSVSTTSLFIWGAQLELGSYASSYIPTTSASATRIADRCFKTGISSLIGQTEGTLFAQFVCVKNSTFSDIASLGTTGTSLVELQFSGSTNILTGVYYASAPLANIPTISPLTIGQTYKVAFAYKTNDFVMYLNGVQQGIDTSGTVVSGMSEISINGYASGANNTENANINQAIIFKTRLTNAELATLTTI